MKYIVPIILDSDKDLDLGSKIKAKLIEFNIDSIIRICSANKSCLRLLKILDDYNNNDNIKVYITINGKSNALSTLVEGNSLKPVISCPSLKDIYSSISMPKGISTLIVLDHENVAVSVAKIYALFDNNIRNMMLEYKKSISLKLHIKDIECRYEFDNHELFNKEILSKCVNDTKNLNWLNGNTKNISFLRKGKVRDVYEFQDSKYALIASDRVSSFDRHLTTIPYKGIVLHQVSNWWFEKTKHLVPNHILNSYDNRTMIVKKCNVFPIEFVMRSYLTGSTQTSIWKNYEKGMRTYCGHDLPNGMFRNQKLNKILLTPTTKDEHDELISEKEILEKNIMSKDQWEKCKNYSYLLFEFGQEVALENGLI